MTETDKLELMLTTMDEAETDRGVTNKLESLDTDHCTDFLHGNRHQRQTNVTRQKARVHINIQFVFGYDPSRGSID